MISVFFNQTTFIVTYYNHQTFIFPSPATGILKFHTSIFTIVL